MPRDSPGMRCACICDDTNASILATSGPERGATAAVPCRLCAAATGSSVNRSASNRRREQKTPLTALRYKLVFIIYSLFFGYRWRTSVLTLGACGASHRVLDEVTGWSALRPASQSPHPRHTNRAAASSQRKGFASSILFFSPAYRGLVNSQKLHTGLFGYSISLW